MYQEAAIVIAGDGKVDSYNMCYKLSAFQQEFISGRVNESAEDSTSSATINVCYGDHLNGPWSLVFD